MKVEKVQKEILFFKPMDKVAKRDAGKCVWDGKDHLNATDSTVNEQSSSIDYMQPQRLTKIDITQQESLQAKCHPRHSSRISPTGSIYWSS